MQFNRSIFLRKKKQEANYNNCKIWFKQNRIILKDCLYLVYICSDINE